MAMKKIISIILLVLSFAFAGFSQSDRDFVRKGNKKYQGNEFAEAELDYSKALEKNPNSIQGIFNLGDALYRQGRYEEAAEKFETAAQMSLQKESRSKAFYNLGNAQVQNFLKQRNNPQPQQPQQNAGQSLEQVREIL